MSKRHRPKRHGCVQFSGSTRLGERSLQIGMCLIAASLLMGGPVSAPAHADFDLAITKVADADPVIAGDDAVFTITVMNLGPSDALTVEVVDTVPDTLDYLFDTGGCVFDAGTSTLACDLGTLTPGESTSFQVRMRVAADAAADDGDGNVVIENTADVTGTGGDDHNLANNTVVAPLLVQDAADLSITKVSAITVEPFEPERLTYTIFVDNVGPSWARGVCITDELIGSEPFEILEVRSDESRADACYVTPAPAPDFGHTIVCELLEPLEPFGTAGETGRWTIHIDVDTGEQEINNVARVYTGANPGGLPTAWENGTPDPDTSNNITTTLVDFEVTADVAIYEAPGDNPHADDLDPVTAGNLLRYSVRVWNRGPSDSNDVRCYNNLPAGVEVVVVTLGDGECVAGTPGDPSDPTLCVIDGLDVGESATMQIFVRVAPDVPINPLLPCDQPAPFCRGRIFDDAWIVADQVDPDLSNNYSTESTDVNYVADLQVFKSDSPDTVVAGEPLSYEVIVNNAGPSTSRAVTMVDNLPDEVEFVSAVVFGRDDLLCEYLPGPHMIVCPLGDIDPGAPPLGQRNIFIEVLVHPDVPAGTLITNSASALTFQTFDNDAANNTDILEDTLIDAQANLVVEKTASTLNPIVGEDLTYTISITNLGPSDATNVEVVDLLPAGFQYVADTGACFEAPVGTLTCHPVGLGPDWVLPAGGTAVFEVLVTPDTTVECGTMAENTVEVTSDNAETTTDSILVRVGCAADLRITKFGKPDDAVRAGEVLEYTVVVDNLGPGAAESVTVVDLLQSSGDFDLIDVLSDRDATCGGLPGPPAATALAATAWPPADPPLTGVDATTGVAGIERRLELSCSLNEPLEPVAPGGPPTTGRWILTMRIRAAEAQSVNNVADVLSNAVELDVANNHAEVEHDITEAADVEIVKTADVAEVFAGDPLTYTLVVTNHGPSTATNIVVQDALPGTVTLMEVTPSQGSALQGVPGDPSSPTIGNLGALAPGASATLTIVVNSPALPNIGPLTNTASVVADQFDPINGNNVSELTTLVLEPEPAGQAVPGDNPFGVFLPLVPWAPLPVCGLELCGAGMVSMTPILLLAYRSFRRRHRRQHRSARDARSK